MISLKKLFESNIKKAAGIFAISKDTKKVLIGLRSPKLVHGNTWGIPGGKMDPNEKNPIITAKREFKEETGFYGNITLTPAYIHNENTFIYYNYIGVVPKEFTAKGDWETVKFKWATMDELNSSMNLHPGLSSLLDDEYSMGIINKFLSNG
jgi:8-oxo-dGTP pyrophosphatase MutT (NUDIX family)